MRVSENDDMPPRMKRGNAERPERVPTEGHEGSVQVDERSWKANDRLRGTAQGHADGQAPQE